MVTVIKEQHVGVDSQSSWVWFGDDATEDIWKCRFTYGPITNKEKLSGESRLWFSSVGTHKKFGRWRKLI